MYISAIVKEIHSKIRLLEDDTSLNIVVDFPDSAAQILKLDLTRQYSGLSNITTLKLNHYWSLEGLIYEITQLSFLMMFKYKKLYLINFLVYLSRRCDWQTHIDFNKEKAGLN